MSKIYEDICRSMASIREAFSNPVIAQGNFYRAQQVRYQQEEPNRFLPENMKANVGSQITSATYTQLGSYDPYTKTVDNKFTLAGVGRLVQGQAPTTEQEEYCRTFTGAGSLQKLMTEQELEGNLPVRCGWRYKKSPGGGLPQVSQAALGTQNGPLNPQEDVLGNGVEWIWNLKKAYTRHLRDIAVSLPPSAQGLVAAQQQFPNAAWCSQSRSFILVDRAGNPMPGYTCARNQITTRAENFPAADTAATQLNASSSQAAASQTDLQRCMEPGNNPSLARDCLLLAVKNNGCSPDGTLYQAIQDTKPSASDYSDFLQQQPSFQTYQSKQGSNQITEELFRKGSMTWEMATREIQKLHRFTQSGVDPLIKVAAQDLCIEAGKFDVYDFCADLTDTNSIVNVDLKCMQNYWQQLNGKPAGLLYPSRRMLNPQLGTINTWGDYRKAVDSLKQKISSSDPIEQRTAVNNFLGVSVSSSAFSPLNIDNVFFQLSQASQPLTFWIDAKDGQSLTIDQNNRVRNWADKSGKGNDLAQMFLANRPVYKKGAQPGIEFDGNSKFFLIPNAFRMVNQNFTIFVVERRRSARGENYFLGGTQYGQNVNLVLGYRYPWAGTLAFWANDFDVTVGNFRNASEPTRMWAFEKSPTGRAIYIDGTRVAGDNNRSFLQSWEGAALGRYAGTFYDGTIYEIMIFNQNLSVDRRLKIEGYLAHKWGLTTQLPTQHPYQTSQP